MIAPMKRQWMRWGILLALLAAVGCRTSDEPSPADLKAHWDAQNVFPRDYKPDLLAFMRSYLNDPSGVRGAGVSRPQLKRVGPGERYVACVRFNARNSDGKYTGAKESAAVFVSGKFNQMVDGKQAAPLCQGVAYAAFPELERLSR
jgi:hypothetical protein